MNTFALMLMAFPFFLAVKGRLTAYTSLATSSGNNTATAGTVGTPSALTPLGSLNTPTTG